MVGAIILAAGASTRMGRQKMLLPFAGSTVVAHVADQCARGGLDAVHVVVGYDAAEVSQALTGKPCLVIYNPDHETGMLSSVRAGLASAALEWTAAFIVLGDQPLLYPGVIERLLDSATANPEKLIAPTFGGKRGHPLVLPRLFWPEVLTQYDEVGLRGVLHAHEDRIVTVDMDTDVILKDMDWQQDYDALREEWERTQS